MSPAILLVTPVAPVSNHGNGVTARRWAGILRGLGYRVIVAQRYQPAEHRASALVALHARKSAETIRAFHADHPAVPIVVAMTGTDLYPDPATAGVDPAVLALAARIIVLQPNGVTQLDPALRERARVVIQSVADIPRQPPRPDRFEVAFLAHLRGVKDPLRLAAAVRLLPASSRIQVTHVGIAHDKEMAAAATRESAANPRYSWLGPVPRDAALELVARSRLLALTSVHEGGANVVSEALAAGTPIIASAIAGSTGLLGEDYPGYFRRGDASDLAAKLAAAETDRDGFYRRLRDHCAALRSLVDPARERQAWSSLFAELALPAPIPAPS
jgi:putative glycosyltransferase (TIGR04348 family)